MRWWMIVGTILAVASLAVEADAQGTGSSASRKVIKLGVSGRPDQASLELALRRGYFAQEGLDVETVQATTGQEMVPSLASNQLQAASGSPNAGLFNALNRNIDIRIVGDFAHIGDAKDQTVAILARADLMDWGRSRRSLISRERSFRKAPVPDRSRRSCFRNFSTTPRSHRRM